MIEIISLSKSYQMGNLEVKVLKNINLTIKEGEFISIMGPSGSGKSTLLYLLGSLDKPSSGTIRFNGEGISKMNDKMESEVRRRDMGFIFQFYNLIPNLNVEENIMIPLLLDGRNINKYKKRLTEIIKIVGLNGRQRHTPRELSGGEQQRVAIARALINQPKIILADEPTGNLDSKTEESIMKLLKKINKEQGKTIVQVTHSEDCANYGNRVIRLRDGELNNCT